MADPLATVLIPYGLLENHFAQVARLEAEIADARVALGEAWLTSGKTLAEGIRAKTVMLEGLAFVQPDRADPMTPTVPVPRDLLDGIVYDLRQGLCLEPETVDVLAGLLAATLQPDEYSDEQTLEVPSGAHHTADQEKAKSIHWSDDDDDPDVRHADPAECATLIVRRHLERYPHPYGRPGCICMHAYTAEGEVFETRDIDVEAIARSERIDSMERMGEPFSAGERRR